MQTHSEISPQSGFEVPSTATSQRVILHGVSWETYQRLLTDLQDSHAAHFAYDQGRLEIMVLSAEHEEDKAVLTLLVNVIAEELGIDVRSFGSATFQREDLDRGFEPDACFYIAHEAQVAGKKKLDLAIDPPPDLIIEINITNVVGVGNTGSCRYGSMKHCKEETMAQHTTSHHGHEHVHDFDEDRARRYDHMARQTLPGYEELHNMTSSLLGVELGDNAHVLVVGAGTGMEILTWLNNTHAGGSPV